MLKRSIKVIIIFQEKGRIRGKALQTFMNQHPYSTPKILTV